jgi:AcrR family transcriptional regulator
LESTLVLLAEHGLEGLSVDAVAARAGVGKATIYRRWQSRIEMVAAALRSLGGAVDVPDTGSVRGDLLTLIQGFQQASHRSIREATIPRLLGITLTNPRLREVFLSDVFGPRRAAVAAVLERGKVRGELRSDFDVDLTFMMIASPVFQGGLQGDTGVIADPETPARLVDIALNGILQTK